MNTPLPSANRANAYPDSGSASSALYERACGVMPGGNTRTTVFMAPYPIYAVRGAGARVYDADGHERLDFINNYTSLIHGHAHPQIVKAAKEQLDNGTCFAMPTESEVSLAGLLCERIESADAIRFMNSGTEAVMMAVKAARAYTLRPKIAKLEGAYHGSYDLVETSEESSPENWGEDAPARVAYSAGTPESVLNEVVVLPLNDTAKAEAILRANARALAAIIIDAMPPRAGLIPCRPDFLAMLRRVADEFGIVLISDEVISFRLGYHGAQGAFDFEADLITLGKIIGGGFPIGAVAGNAKVMSVFDGTKGKPPAPHGGTFNANPMSMTAGRTAMELMDRAEFARIDALGDQLRADVTQLFAEERFPAQITGRGSLARLHMKSTPILDYRSGYPSPEERHMMNALFRSLINNGILIGSTGLMAISTAMKASDIQDFISALRESLRQVRDAPA
ncbi:aspartate aminotransferase family protein [Bosea sp. NPDC055594]